MNHTTYAIQDMNVVLNHPSMGKFSANGKGFVSVTFGRATDMSSQDVAADGSVMTSKVTAKNGTVVIVVQQASRAAKWLTKLTNYLENADAAQFTKLSMSASSKFMGRSHVARPG